MRIIPFSMIRLSSAVIGVIFAAVSTHGEVKLPPLISSHMVLQRDMAVPVWGTAAPDEEVTVEFAGQKKSAHADGDGRWSVKLAAMPASAEPRTMTIRAGNTLTLDDVLVGEVWVGSGQSNMAGDTGRYAKNDPVLAEMLKENHPLLRKFNSRGWEAANETTSARFSALLFSFGARLQKDLNVPVGLMVGAVGGTPSGFWLSPEAFAADEGCRQAIAKAAASFSPEEAQKKYSQALANWEKATAVAKQKGGTTLPHKPLEPSKPGECHGEIGHLYKTYIRPFIPYGIRGVLWDQGESGTAIEGVDQFTLMGALIRGWRKEWGQGDFPFLYMQKPSGDGCAFDLSDPVTKNAEAFSLLPVTVPNDGQYRETHLRIREYPNTAMVTSSDLGHGVHPTNKSGYGARAARVALGFVYGRNVESYGPVYRSHKIEGNKIRISFSHVGQGLVFRGGDKLQGFALAGDDKQYAWAEAVIEGNDVIVSSEKIAKPVAIRYAWSGRHPWANLFNKDGLPALPFRLEDGSEK